MRADEPKSLGDPEARAKRLRQIREHHIAPLTAYVEQLRQLVGPNANIPYFDPWDGGIEARALFLLEAPGAKAASSGFVSRNNPDETAKNLFTLLEQAGLERRETLIWNAVPWYIGSGTKIRAATTTDLHAGLRPLPLLLDLLPNLTTVVLLGRKAAKAREHVSRSRLRVFECPHPSPLFINHAPGNRQKLLEVFVSVRKHLSEPQPSG